MAVCINCPSCQKPQGLQVNYKAVENWVVEEIVAWRDGWGPELGALIDPDLKSVLNFQCLECEFILVDEKDEPITEYADLTPYLAASKLAHYSSDGIYHPSIR